MNELNQLYYGDNLEILRYDVKNPGKFLIENESVDVIYIDPPFNSDRDYNVIYESDGHDAAAQVKAFSDTWSLIGVEDLESIIEKEQIRYANIQQAYDVFKKLLRDGDRYDRSMYAYLINMALRISELHRKLKPSGTFFLHCDTTAAKYLQILLDCVFGQGNFLNEIIWHYQTGGTSKHWFSRKHDNIYFYAKNIKKHFFAPEKIKISRTPEVLKRISSGIESATRSKGEFKLPHDVLIIPAINSMAKERMGYPTQKPLELLRTLLKATCPMAGDKMKDGSTAQTNGRVLDAFCGCGTTIAAAQEMGMSWIGIDITYLAVDLILKQRLLPQYYGLNEDLTNYKESLNKLKKDVFLYGIPKDLESAKALVEVGKLRKEFEKWAVLSVGGVPQDKLGADGGVDGVFYVNETQKERVKGYVSVKSGVVSVKDVRDFESALNFKNSPIGIFITLEEATKPMLEFIQSLKSFDSAWYGKIPKITLIQVRDIIENPNTIPPYIRSVLKQSKNISTPKNATFDDEFYDDEGGD